ncbi:serine hydrolase domain-containing protein [Tessaracoccus sp. G1721]
MTVRRPSRVAAGALILWAAIAVLAVAMVRVAAAQEPLTPAPVAASHRATPAEIGDFVERRAAELRLAGLAVVVVRDGEVYQESYLGTAGSGRPVTRDTPFVLGSTSKQFTALAVQRLIADGRLSLETRLDEVFTGGLGGGGLGGVTVGDLLGHTSGLSTSTGLGQWGWWPGRPDSIEANAEALASANPAVLPAAYAYSNSNYDLLGAVVEQVTGQTFESAMARLVYTPLGLTHTSATPTPRAVDGVAMGHHPWLELFTAPTPCPCTPGAVPSAFQVSTAGDLTRLVGAHLGSVSADVPAEVLEAAREPLATVDAYSRYGSGWVVRPLWELLDGAGDPLATTPDGTPLPTCVDHLGSTYRSQSYLLACPTLGLGIVAVTNTGAGLDTTRWARFQSELTHVVLGTPAPPPSFNPIEANAALVVLGVLLAQSLTVVPVLGRRSPVRSVVAVAGAAVSLGLWWGYAPARLGCRVPLASLWAGAPELGLATLVSTALAVTALTVVFSRRRGAG